ncbi:MAG: ribonuclease III domain-containing protein [Promethearchaeota archaeon]|jgi:ribonuclease-3
MSPITIDKIRKFQDFIDYKFKNEEFLIQSLTTPRFANESVNELESYEFLETLGDAVIKIIFILKLYKSGIKDPGEITKIKASLESDTALKEIGNKMKLNKFIFNAKKEIVEDTRILADVFEAICGALFLDSEYNINLVATKMINPFINDLDTTLINKLSPTKNDLLEFLQEKFKTTIFVKLEYEKRGSEHDPIWLSKNPQLIEKDSQKIIIDLPKYLKSKSFSNKKDAEKDIYLSILKYLKSKEI